MTHLNDTNQYQPTNFERIDKNSLEEGFSR